MNTVYLSIGTNMGNRAANLELVHSLISRNIGIVAKESNIYETEPWGVEGQENYYNQVLCVKTALEPAVLLHKCQVIEQKMGRSRIVKWEPRVMDIDILFFNDLVVKEEGLEIPHPLLQERNFVLKPLAELTTDWVHPILNKNVQELLEACTDKASVVLLELAD
ncbi:2-amino-4-hydroxy-6-hydroxymethyldihydropteridine diphosphokinase [Aureispira sp. CCB-E]|uniref:2-amino-4-hydroxy-6- hydroxymethyldihydropteridine diphosphokinase n=1 Tax=Aureispira sp. CCB-E TaxID=3051121 RepID=UPI002868B335|nr:2-amino-4-hydroxy-6-hydroxymethyldihydropteridine diphosphokinase [Aureispira sp. CCB-E]WMX12469.1 2-amino-4-hydroxy-6-hydroxymethyldihydropteridine diphosphokinase [Aureispira sp. CCB-E]